VDDGPAWPAEGGSARHAGGAQRAPSPAAPFEGYVVGIGASAGGLEALERLFKTLPCDTGAAFVVVQHLSPDHKSMMDNLLARHTAMPVQVAEHEMPLAPDAVFLIPPGMTMRLAGHRLLLAPKPELGLSLPIDIFFHSLAEQCGDRAIAVVLSGTGSDGSRGVPAVNAGGGFVFVQDPESARFDGMPRSAIATGQVDVVAPAEQLAAHLVHHLCLPRAQMPTRAHVRSGPSADPMDGILERLLASSGIDFRQYKTQTVRRRIERRMQVLHTASMGEYLARLTASPDEQTLLRRELLIPVTRFFRDAEAFEQLAERVIPALLEAPVATEPIRVWVACCATGEEAYSVAILFAESFRRLGRSRAVKIFATDIESQYIEHAAAGVYPATIAAEVSTQRLRHVFVERGEQVAVKPEIRQMVIFALHNLVADPPFTRMDLVCCRNALIYLQPAAQEQALQRLQYALVPGGHLFLGPSESLGVLQRNFLPLPGRHKIYRLLRRERLTVSLGSTGRHLPTAALPGGRARNPRHPLADGAPDWVVQGQQALLRAYAPVTLLLGPNRDLLHVWGDASELLQIGSGTASLDVLQLLPRELGWAAALLLTALASEGQPQRSAPLRWTRASDDADPAQGGNAQARVVRLVARPLPVPEAGEAMPADAAPAADAPDPGDSPAPVPRLAERLPVLLSIEPVLDPAANTAAAGQPEAAAMDVVQQRRIDALEQELALSHDHLQATVEELETANEELQATNEELMAANEELQSTNEELQSVNEELYTVNSEYQEKVDILNSLNADLENVSKAAAIPTLFVDAELQLLRFTPEASLLFKIRAADTGRSLEDFAHTLEYPELFADLRQTLASGMALEREVRSRDGQWWLARMQPYRGRSGALGGGLLARAVLTFFNVTSLKDSQRLQALLDALPEHVAVLDGHGSITMVNAAWQRFACENSDDADAAMNHTGTGRNYLEVCARAAISDAYAKRALDGLTQVLAGQQPRFTLQYPCHSDEQRRWFLMNVAKVPLAGGGVVVSHIDITAWAEPVSGRPDTDPGTPSTTADA
jgi:two-component system CheB/CheR fusion protein